MENDIINRPPGQAGLTFQQQSGNITNIGEVANLHRTTVQQTTYYISSGIPGMPGSTPVSVSLSRDYYNLIVWGSEPFFEQRHVTITKDRALVERENITSELKAWLSPLTDEAIAALKSFPCIIANENLFYGRTDETQYAVLAAITNIKKRTNGIEVYFHPFHGLPQKALNELRNELGIFGSSGFNEFNHSHWTVKEIDLLEVLAEHGLKQI